jgi:hypothetical protein
VAECGGLENRYGVTPIVGSNPTPSALTSSFVLPGELRRRASDAAVRSRARYVPVRFGVVPAARRPRRAATSASRRWAACWQIIALRRQGESRMPQVVQMDVG